jgi:hypothetical protein
MKLAVWRCEIGLIVAMIAMAVATALPAQQAHSTKPILPANMDCQPVTGDKEVPANASIIKRGATYYLCKPKTQELLSRARTAALAVRSTQTISCGDGSTSDCIREDVKTKTQIEVLADATDLWRYFERATPAKADLIIQFVANERASPASLITLQVQDADSGAWAYYESRTVTDIENDVNKLVDHFVATIHREPIVTKEEMKRQRECTLAANQVTALQAEYQRRLTEYEFKNSHPLDAQMDECNLHWKEWVCLKRGGSDSGVSYAEQWNESGAELRRKLTLEFEELRNLQRQIAALNQRACSR